MRQQRLAAARTLLQPFVAAFGKRPITGKAAIEVCLGNVVQLLAGHVGAVEGNTHITNLKPFCVQQQGAIPPKAVAIRI